MRLVELSIDNDYADSIKRNMSTCVKDIVKESYTQNKLNIHIHYIREDNIDLAKNKVYKIKENSIFEEGLREIVVLYMDEILNKTITSKDISSECKKVINFYDDLKNNHSDIIIIFCRTFKHTKSEKKMIKKILNDKNSHFRFMTIYKVDHSYLASVDDQFNIKTKKIK